MKKKVLLSLITATLLLTNEAGAFNFSDVQNGTHVKSKAIYAKNEAIISFKEGANIAYALKRLHNLLGKFTHHEYSLINAIHIKVPGKSFKEIQKLLKQLSIVKSIEKNYANSAFKSNDTYYSKLWAIENTGQKVNNTSGTKDADMDVDEAWKIEKGEHDVVVAVLDTGVDYTHNDLADNMWSGNRHHGYDFAGDNNGNNDNDPMPDTPYDDNGHYHGTHVAGTIGAVGDNNQGVSGVAQNVQIMAVKVFRPNGYGYNSDILEGLDYVSKAVDNGINIVAINASYGGSGGSNGDSMDQAIQKLGEKGVVFCAAAGNDGKNIDNDPIYPASYDASNIITVAASDQNDKLANFSNYGKKTVEVAAPGTNILSTYPDNKYAYLQGTSMATPQVAGTVALLASVNPNSSVDERIKAIEQNVDTKSSLTNRVSTNGRVNTYQALKALDEGTTPNTPPNANNDSATTQYETKVTIDVLANDSDSDGDTLTIESLTNPKHGSAVIRNQKIDYTPAKGFSGTDNFSYTINDGNGGKASATVEVTVEKSSNHAPQAKDDTATTEYETSVTIDVLKNDSDSDGDTLTIQSISTPSHGTAKIQNGKVKYTPNKGFSGKDSFQYSISDGNGGSSTATVTVTVKEKPNTPPKANDDSATTKYETSVTIDVLANDNDNDGDTLTIQSLSNPSNGSAKIQNGKVKYTPNKGFSGKDSFQYSISDGKGGSSSATVTVTVKEKKKNNGGFFGGFFGGLF